jgi:hypothetical protein
VKTLIITLALCCAALASAQTINVTISGVSPSIVADLNTHWLDQIALAGNVVGAIDGTSSTVTITISQSLLSAQAAMPTVGQTVLIGQEPMSCTAAAGGSYTLQRAVFPLTVLTAHAAGATISILRYASPWDMLSAEALRPWLQGVITQLGTRSATLGATVSGSISQ